MAAGYVTDVQYTGEFHEHLAPAWLAYIAAINGYDTPSLASEFSWCELGCGKGMTALTLAATHPGGRFHACDFNADHIAYGERLRVEAGMDNLTLYASSFEQMLEADLPAFDFIVLHGVYSWVPPQVRGQVVEFLRARLKPGGLAMVSYNAMPGWAALQPLRRMMNSYAANLPSGTSIERAKQAYAYADFLAKNGAGFFAAVPAAAQHLKRIAAQDIRYVAHEYVTPHGDPFYFSDVARHFAAAGLSFAGSMAAEDNYPELMASPVFAPLLASAKSRDELETHRDIIANTMFRRDLFARQPERMAPRDVPLERLDAVSFCLVNLPERLPMRSEQGALQFDLGNQEVQVRRIHGLLLHGPASASDIHRALGVADLALTALLIQKLVVSRHLAPCPPRRAQSGWSRLNTAIVDAGLREQQPSIPLAAPSLGAASYADVVHAAVIDAAASCTTAEQAAGAVLARLRRHRHPVNRRSPAGELRAASDDEVREYVAATWSHLTDASHPDARLLRLIGVLN
jgi:2-polyprenyl-3-methyl-5-hydroxy-6-metoxy-1,4-benzoquinol methylase